MTRAGDVVAFEMTENIRRLTGWDLPDLTRWGEWSERVTDLDAAAWQRHFERVVRAGEATVEYRLPGAGGDTLWLRDQARVFERGDDGATQIVGYISDITSERDLRAQAVASAKLATLGEMATGLAHELNQPIAIMSLAAENSVQALLRKGPDGIDFAVKRLHRITDQCGRARTIVDHLRIFGRSDEGDLGPIAVRSMIDGALTLVEARCARPVSIWRSRAGRSARRPRTRRAGRAGHREPDVECPRCDGSPSRRAKPSLAHHRDGRSALGLVSVEVGDSGPGISPAAVDRLFEPFFTTKEVGKGLGSACPFAMASCVRSAATSPRGMHRKRRRLHRACRAATVMTDADLPIEPVGQPA